MDSTNPDRYQICPPLTDYEYERLKADIQTNGILVPVVVDEAGAILDGHHRARIAAELGIEYPTQTHAGLSEPEKMIRAAGLNLQRRQLTDAGVAVIMQKLKPYYDQIGRERREANLRKGQNVPSGDSAESSEKSLEQMLSETGSRVTPKTARRAIATAAEAEQADPELYDKMSRSEVTLRQARQALKSPEPPKPHQLRMNMQFEDDLAEAIQAEADRRGLTAEEFVRTAVLAALSLPGARRRQVGGGVTRPTQEIIRPEDTDGHWAAHGLSKSEQAGEGRMKKAQPKRQGFRR